jgi:DNA repair protein RadC
MLSSESPKNYSATPISSWALEDRPREKMNLKGKNVLSDAELIAILLGSGTRDETALEVAKKVLISVNNNLNHLGELSIRDFKKFRGIGPTKAVIIAAALELGRRWQASETVERNKIMSSKDAYHILAPMVMDLSHEEFWVLALNRANKVLGKIFISSGGLAGTIVDTKKLFHKVLDFDRVSALVLCHNHPSGNVSPSESDKELTKKIIAGGKLLDISILDHLIISGNKYLSFADEGILYP